MKRFTVHIVRALALLTLPLSGSDILHAQATLVDILEIDDVVHDIAFRNGSEGYAITDDRVLTTTDGGTTWAYSMPLVFRPPFRSIALFGDAGMIIGDAFGGVHHTADPETGWTTYTLLESGSPVDEQPILEIEAVDGAHWVAISDMAIHTTRDSGATFSTYAPSKGRGFVSIDITDPGLMHAAESIETVFRSTDGGTTWGQLPTSQTGFGEIYDATFISADTGFVASWYPWNLYTTVDGGVTWMAGPYEYPTSISVSPEGPGAYATAEYVRISSDRGMTWTDSVAYPDLVVDGEPISPFGWSEQKVVVTEAGGVVLLLSAPEQGRSIIARVDVTSGVIEEENYSPADLDLTLQSASECR